MGMVMARYNCNAGIADKVVFSPYFESLDDRTQLVLFKASHICDNCGIFSINDYYHEYYRNGNAMEFTANLELSIKLLISGNIIEQLDPNEEGGIYYVITWFMANRNLKVLKSRYKNLLLQKHPEYKGLESRTAGQLLTDSVIDGTDYSQYFNVAELSELIEVKSRNKVLEKIRENSNSLKMKGADGREAYFIPIEEGIRIAVRMINSRQYIISHKENYESIYRKVQQTATNRGVNFDVIIEDIKGTIEGTGKRTCPITSPHTCPHKNTDEYYKNCMGTGEPSRNKEIRNNIYTDSNSYYYNQSSYTYIDDEFENKKNVISYIFKYFLGNEISKNDASNLIRISERYNSKEGYQMLLTAIRNIFYRGDVKSIRNISSYIESIFRNWSENGSISVRDIDVDYSYPTSEEIDKFWKICVEEYQSDYYTAEIDDGSESFAKNLIILFGYFKAIDGLRISLVYRKWGKVRRFEKLSEALGFALDSLKPDFDEEKIYDYN